MGFIGASPSRQPATEQARLLMAAKIVNDTGWIVSHFMIDKTPAELEAILEGASSDLLTCILVSD